ncbi:hypothetical protein ACQPZP_36890 [Spirillospora sp. CA-142024]|uniref:hypothetical protein n=1 Tax=Spirillospora sp. CA-142024 TaxID=3240036 RepID=UPI003D8A02BE
MSNTTPAKQPAHDPRRSTIAGEQKVQQDLVAELDEKVASGEVDPKDLPAPGSPSTWG